MKIHIKNKKVLDALVDELESKLEILQEDMPEANDTEDLESIVIPDIKALKTPTVYTTTDMPNLMGDYVVAAWENLQEQIYCNFRDDGREYCEGHIRPEDLPDAWENNQQFVSYVKKMLEESK